MKSCPVCSRTYPDDTLAFCLVDGSILSAPYDPEERRPPLPKERSEPAPTEILPDSSPQTRKPALTTIEALPFAKPRSGLESKPDKASSLPRKSVRIIVVLGSLAAIIGAVFIFFPRHRTPSSEVDGGTVTTGASPVSTESSSTPQNQSTFSGSQSANTPAPATHPSTPEPQPRVSQNQKLETYEAEARKTKIALDAAQSEVQDQEKKLNTAKGNLEQRNADLRAADLDLKRAQGLFEKQFISKADLDAAQARYNSNKKLQSEAQTTYLEVQTSYGRAKDRYDEAQRNFKKAEDALRGAKVTN